jgi:hypothetical protein
MSFIEDPVEKRIAMECMIRQLAENSETLIGSFKPERLDAIAIGRIDIEEMSGKVV